MTTFAHIETGRALEPWPNASSADYLARFPGVNTSGWDVAQVPSGTAHGAISDGQGGWVNPASPVVSVSVPLNHTAQNRAIVLGRARVLDKKGKYSEANALRATLGE